MMVREPNEQRLQGDAISKHSPGGAVRLSRSFLTQLGLYISLCGVSLSAFLFGAQSAEYYALILMGLALCIPLFITQTRRQMHRLAIAGCIVLFPLLLYLIHGALLANYGVYKSSPLAYFGLSVTLVLAVAAGLLPEARFKDLMYWVSISHVLLALYGLRDWGAIAAQSQQVRFSALGVREAVWAELVLGGFVAALLSGRRWLIATAAGVAGIVLFGTQMRGSAIALLAGLGTYVYVLGGGRKWLRLSLPVLLIASAAMLVYYEDVITLIKAVFLIDDPHRGLHAGFSGRFDNWRDGIMRFLESPVVGVGLNDPAAGYTHNGYLKILAQLGGLYGLVMIGVLFIALRRAVRGRRADLLASIICYAVFLMSTPRYINFQLMPFVGLAAIASVYFSGQRLVHSAGGRAYSRRHAIAASG